MMFEAVCVWLCSSMLAYTVMRMMALGGGDQWSVGDCRLAATVAVVSGPFILIGWVYLCLCLPMSPRESLDLVYRFYTDDRPSKW